MEKRPWRFKMLFASAVVKTAAAVDGSAVPGCGGCFAAAANHRNFRAFIRKQEPGNMPRVQIAGDALCSDGSHVSRPGKKVLHGMLGEIFDEYIWGNGAMARKDGAVTVDLRIAGMENSVIAGNLRNIPGVMNFPDLEEL